MAEQSEPQASRPAAPIEEQVKPPLPKWAYRILNPTMIAIMRSPLHGLLSGALMLLAFKGRKSGKRYTIPVGYMQENNRLYVFSHAPWWRNLPGQPVSVRLRGKELRGIARRLEDKHEISLLVRKSVTKRGEAMAERMGLMEYADPDRPGPLPQRTKFFEITLEETAG